MRFQRISDISTYIPLINEHLGLHAFFTSLHHIYSSLPARRTQLKGGNHFHLLPGNTLGSNSRLYLAYLPAAQRCMNIVAMTLYTTATPYQLEATSKRKPTHCQYQSQS